MKEDEIRDKLTHRLRANHIKNIGVVYNGVDAVEDIIFLIKDEVRKGQKECLKDIWTNHMQYKEKEVSKYTSLMSAISNKLNSLNNIHSPL